MVGGQLTPRRLIQAYGQGIFPMAEGRTGQVTWCQPDPRAILPLDPVLFRIKRSLAKRVRSGRFGITFDRAFDRVIEACAEPRAYEPETWLSDELIAACKILHRRGMAHSIEAWLDDPALGGFQQGDLVGGLYGVTLGGAYFGESMFSRINEASQVCLVHLVRHLRERGFVLLDVQFQNPHLKQFGALEIPNQQYLRRLDYALRLEVSW